MNRLCLIAVLFLLPARASLGQAGKADSDPKARLAATFTGGAVTWSDFYEELARRHRGKALGKDGLDHLIEKSIVEAEAARRGLTVSKQEVETYLQELERQLATQKRSLREHLRSRATTLESFRDYVSLSRLYERLARQDLGLDAKTPLDAGRRKLWITEQKRKHAVVIDVAKLPQDAAALVDGKPIPLRELGRTMARNLVADERHSILRQMVAYRLLQREAAKHEVEITAADYEKALARKRAEIARNPEYKKHGVNLERLLQAQGRSVDDMTRGEVFRAEVLIGSLGSVRFPDATLEKSLAENAEVWDRRVGKAREVHRLLLAVGDKSTNRGPARTEEQAFADAKMLRDKIRGARQFAAAARRFSSDAGSRQRGGRLGWLQRETGRRRGSVARDGVQDGDRHDLGTDPRRPRRLALARDT